jgi:AcrR family transcriptional regulator
MMKKKIRERTRKRTATDKSIQRRSEIYSKALELFLAKGYDATSLALIAKRMGISKANLYYYCPSKRHLLFQIYMDDIEKRFIPILNEVEQLADPKERVIYFLRNFSIMCCSSKASQVFVQELHNLRRRHRDQVISIWRRAYELVYGAVRELRKSGKARKFRESFLTFLGIGMAFWTMYWWDYSRQENADELADTMIEIFLNGLLYPINKKR